MKVKELHRWQLGIPQALELQRRLARRVIRSSEITTPRFIAGVDISVRRVEKTATGAVVILSYPHFRVVKIEIACGRLDFPYVPGLLSFRELPLYLAAFKKCSVTPDVILVDGQGVAHPRRFGIASHLGLVLDTPTIGCAKSRLCGKNVEPGIEPGDYAEIVDCGETIGVALRTKPGVKPVYVSVGHKVDLQTAIHWVMMCCRGYRLPEPTRLAHLATKGNLKLEKVALT